MVRRRGNQWQLKPRRRTKETQDRNGGSEGRNTGRIEEIQGVVIEAVFPEKLPEIDSAIYIEREASEDDEKISGGISQPPDLRGPAAPRRRPCPRGRHGHD